MIPFGEWAPDLPDMTNGTSVEALNVLPSGTSYRSMSGLSEQTTALDARCQGLFSAKAADGASFNFAGDATKLYSLTNATWSNVTNLGGPYTVAELNSWQFLQYKQDVIAMHIDDYPQIFTLNSSSNFSNLTTAVKAAHCAVVNGFLVVGNTYDSTDGAVPYRVRWPSRTDITDWTVSPVTMADYQDLDSAHGDVMAITNGSHGLIFQERAITRMTFVGSPLVFQFDEMEYGRGTIAYNSVVQFGNLVAYLAEDGFYVFDGVSSQDIGANKVDKYFFSDLESSYASRVYGVVDPINHFIIWFYPGTGNNNGIPNKYIAYNYAQNSNNRWAHGEIELEIVGTSLSTGYTLETMDTYSTNLDSIGISLDSRFWTGGSIMLSAFSTNHKMAYFTNSTLSATIDTNEFEITPGRKTHLRSIMPMIDGVSSVTAAIGSRNNLGDAVTWGSSITPSANGEILLRNNARFQRIRLNITGDFNFAQGININKAIRGSIR